MTVDVGNDDTYEKDEEIIIKIIIKKTTIVFLLQDAISRKVLPYSPVLLKREFFLPLLHVYWSGSGFLSSPLEKIMIATDAVIFFIIII